MHQLLFVFRGKMFTFRLGDLSELYFLDTDATGVVVSPSQNHRLLYAESGGCNIISVKIVSVITERNDHINVSMA